MATYHKISSKRFLTVYKYNCILQDGNFELISSSIFDISIDVDFPVIEFTHNDCFHQLPLTDEDIQFIKNTQDSKELYDYFLSRVFSKTPLPLPFPPKRGVGAILPKHLQSFYQIIQDKGFHFVKSNMNKAVFNRSIKELQDFGISQRMIQVVS